MTYEHKYHGKSNTSSKGFFYNSMGKTMPFYSILSEQMLTSLLARRTVRSTSLAEVVVVMLKVEATMVSNRC